MKTKMKANSSQLKFAKTALVAFLIPLTLGTSAAFAAQTLNVTGGSVTFLAIGKPSAIKIRGTGGAPTGQIEIEGREVKGDFAFDLNSLTTGIELRNHHMKEKYLQTDKYPKATFKITKLTLPSDFKADGFHAEKVPMEGQLTLHGETKPVKGSATISSASGTAQAHVEFGTSIPDYKIDTPTYMGIKVADHVDVETNVTAVPVKTSPQK